MKKSYLMALAFASLMADSYAGGGFTHLVFEDMQVLTEKVDGKYRALSFGGNMYQLSPESRDRTILSVRDQNKDLWPYVLNAEHLGNLRAHEKDRIQYQIAWIHRDSPLEEAVNAPKLTFDLICYQKPSKRSKK